MYGMTALHLLHACCGQDGTGSVLAVLVEPASPGLNDFSSRGEAAGTVPGEVNTATA